MQFITSSEASKGDVPPANETLQRAILPIRDVRHTRDANVRREGSRYEASAHLRCGRPRAPNVLLLSCSTTSASGASSAFGGPCETPTAERLAANGLKFNRFHTTALCSPTRAALLSGRNHHTGRDGRHHGARRPRRPATTRCAPTRARRWRETLKLNGYSTAQFGKCHEVPVWQTSPMGPFDAWPTGGGGFEYFYGFIGGETNQYYPARLRGHDAGRARDDAGAGLPLHRGHDRQGDHVDRASRSRSCPTSRSSCTSRRARRTRRTTCRRNGRPSTRGASTRAGTRCASETFARQKELGVMPAGRRS